MNAHTPGPKCFACDRPALTPAQEAAPEMLEALRALMQPFAASGRVTPDNPHGQLTARLSDGTLVDRYAYARDAIAKAEGRTP